MSPLSALKNCTRYWIWWNITDCKLSVQGKKSNIKPLANFCQYDNLVYLCIRGSGVGEGSGEEGRGGGDSFLTSILLSVLVLQVFGVGGGGGDENEPSERKVTLLTWTESSVWFCVWFWSNVFALTEGFNRDMLNMLPHQHWKRDDASEWILLEVIY